jgi:hypothetical protein
MMARPEWKEVRKKKVASLTSVDYETKVRHFLESFKTKPCANAEFHDFNLCPDYHVPTNGATSGDQRRNPFEQPYSVDEATGPMEKYFHPLMYKTQMCSDHKCKREGFCAKAHCESQLRDPHLVNSIYAQLLQSRGSHGSQLSQRQLSSFVGSAAAGSPSKLKIKSPLKPSGRDQLHSNQTADKTTVPDSWSCDFCTCINSIFLDACEACGNAPESLHRPFKFVGIADSVVQREIVLNPMTCHFLQLLPEVIKRCNNACFEVAATVTFEIARQKAIVQGLEMNVQEAMSVLAALLDEMITACGKHTLVRYQEIDIPSRLLKLDGKRQEL